MGSYKIKTWVKVVWVAAVAVCFVAGLLSTNNIAFMIAIAAGAVCVLILAIYYGEIDEYENEQLEDVERFMRRTKG